jgi:hypothetical protein
MNESLPRYTYRRTADDEVIDFAEALQAEPNVVGRARHEPIPDAPPPLISSEVSGIEYPRTSADRRAELEASVIDDNRWEQFGPTQ